MPHAYTEDQLVEQPAIGLFGELGWQCGLDIYDVHGPPMDGYRRVGRLAGSGCDDRVQFSSVLDGGRWVVIMATWK
jgi:hypothetical protein